jgi:hypothetical protein
MEASLGFDSSHNMGSNSLTFDPYLLLIGSGSPPVTSLDNSIDADIAGHLAHELGNSQYLPTVKNIPLTYYAQATYSALIMNTRGTMQHSISTSNVAKFQVTQTGPSPWPQDRNEFLISVMISRSRRSVPVKTLHDIWGLRLTNTYLTLWMMHTIFCTRR